MKLNKILLIIIILIATLLRIYKIDSYPSINPDEAALGYNAYSLIKTGKDEHGAVWPLHFKSFGDYKPGGYVYLALPFIYLFDLNTLSVRLPNILLSIVSIYFLYLVIKNITKNESLSLLTIFLIAVSPWHIQFSRGSWESCTALSFTIIGIYFYLKERWIISALLFSASMYTYHSARIVTPLLILLLFYVFKKVNKKFIVILLIATLPVLVSFLKNGGTARFGGVGITADQGPLWRANELLNHHMNTKIFNRVMHNQRILYSLSWLEKYTSHYNLNFLYTTGDAVPRSKIPESGQSHMVLVLFFSLGIYFLLKDENTRLKKIIIGLILISPLASSLTYQAPSALRSLPMVIPLEFISAYGIFSLYKKIYYKKAFKVLFTIAILWSVGSYLTTYYYRYTEELPTSWPWTAKQSIENKDYQNIDADQPYIMYLFYTKYDPSRLQAQIKLTPPDIYGFSTVEQIDDIIFKPKK